MLTTTAKAAESNVAVKGYAERINRLEDERDELGEDIKQIYKEASTSGVDRRALKDAIRVKRKEVNVAHKLKVNAYLEELGELPLFALVK